MPSRCRLPRRTPHVLGLAADPAPSRRRRIADDAELGGDDDLVAPAADRAADELLVGERAVDVGGVEEVDAELDGAMDRRDPFGLVARSVELGHAHAAEAEGRDTGTGVRVVVFACGSQDVQVNGPLAIRRGVEGGERGCGSRPSIVATGGASPSQGSTTRQTSAGVRPASRRSPTAVGRATSTACAHPRPGSAACAARSAACGPAPATAHLHGALIEQVRAAHHLGHAVGEVVGDDREVVGVDAVAAPQDRIAQRRRDRCHAAAGAIDERHGAVGQPEADRPVVSPRSRQAPDRRRPRAWTWRRGCSRSSR